MKAAGTGIRSLAGPLTLFFLVAGCTENAPTGIAAAAETPAFASMEHSSTAGGFRVEPLARGGFPDEVAVMFRIKRGRATQVVNVKDPSDVLTARITFEPGGSVGWHTHPGPAIVTVAAGALTIINANDCVPRIYSAGQAFIDPGQGNVHIGYNATGGQTVVYATFLDVPQGAPATIPADDPGC